MRIKAVNGIKICRDLRSHHRKICSRPTTKHHHINFIFHRKHIVKMLHFCASRLNHNSRRISSGENSLQFHIIITGNCLLYTSANISIPNNTNSDFSHCLLLPFFYLGRSIFTKAYVPNCFLTCPFLTYFCSCRHIFLRCHQREMAFCIFCAKKHAF